MKIEWHSVTWYSKLIAVVAFFAVFSLGIYIGIQYEGAVAFVDYTPYIAPLHTPIATAPIPASTTIQKGSQCASDANCSLGLLCHTGVCTNPIGNRCSGPGGNCPSGYTCIQSCGPPVVRSDSPPPFYYCDLNEYAAKPRMCPICLASNSMIATPHGGVNVTDMAIGMQVWSLNKEGQKVLSTVIAVSKTPVPDGHQMVHLVLADHRQVWVSQGHPTADGRIAANLRAGNSYDGSLIISTELVPYWDRYTYDILPNSDTGEYWANGILLGSTLLRE